MGNWAILSGRLGDRQQRTWAIPSGAVGLGDHDLKECSWGLRIRLMAEDAATEFIVYYQFCSQDHRIRDSGSEQQEEEREKRERLKGACHY